MQIQCPHCSKRLKLDSPKPGLYQPNCKKCGSPFFVHVSADEPPRIDVSATDSMPPVADDVQRTEQGARTIAERPAEQRSAAGTSLSGPSMSGTSMSGPSMSGPSPSNPPGTDAGARSDRSRVGGSAIETAGEELSPPPSRLGGYRIVRMIGRGAMGAVYHAKQISLDRDVALKTIRGRLADNPASLARFTREAYAAAQLSHHNVVQIYDFGEEEGLHYFSMEWIRGGSLGDLVREKGAIDPKLAASYILQAARGLQYAHRNGMVHRDVKPANLLLGEDGVVKVADLGLVKIPDQVDPDDHSGRVSYSGLTSGTQVTLQGTAVGTPAYMAPEQGSDASTVDHRADIYSLGCSLFFLLAGRSPYDGSQVSEMMQQHARAPLPDLAAINARVPEPLRDIVAHAMAKRPSDRFESLAGMIEELQSFLGVEAVGGFSPRSDQADRWETIVARFSRTQVQHHVSGPTLVLAAFAAVLLSVVFGWWSLATVLVGPTFLVVACALVVGLGATVGRSAVIDRVREYLGSLSRIEIGIATFALSVTAAVLVVGGFWLGVLAGVVLGTVAGVGFHFAIDRPGAVAGRTPLDEARRFIRDLRLEGADETGLRDFLARYAGKHWQDIYEALFGYDALLAARRRLASDRSFDGPVIGDDLRDRVCQALARRAEANRQAANRKKLAKLEQRSLLSQGLSQAEATERSWQVASAIMETARPSDDVSLSINPKDDLAVARAKRLRTLSLLADARSGRYKRPPNRLASLRLAFTGYTRMLAGSLMLAAFAFAAQASGLTAPIVAGVHGGDVDWIALLNAEATTEVFGIPIHVWSLGTAGLLMCLSAFVSGWRMTPFAVVATAVILFGARWGVPSIALPGVGIAPAWLVAVAAGLLVYLPGAIYGEETQYD